MVLVGISEWLIELIGLGEWCAGHYTDFEPLMILITLISLIFCLNSNLGN
jgi:hypothetical protein